MPSSPTRRLRGLLLLFAVLVLAQAGHLVEHVAQVVQFHVLGRSAAASAGLLTWLDTEWVHFVWNTLILAAVVPLLWRYRDNRWLWLAGLAAVWHEVEHAYLIFEYLRTGQVGLPGLLADGGVLAGGLDAPRIDLHFWYNVVEAVPLFVAFAVELRRVRRVGPAREDRGVDARRIVRRSVAATAVLSTSLVGIALAIAPEDRELAMLQAYATDFPLAMAAPTFVPEGFALVDGNGPWTELDLDQDGNVDTLRAELLYAPPRHDGMAPLMMSMETMHDLSPLAGGYEQVELPNGLVGWLSVGVDNPWDALLWNHEGLTFGIQSSGIPVEQMLRIAASMQFVPEG